MREAVIDIKMLETEILLPAQGQKKAKTNKDGPGFHSLGIGPKYSKKRSISIDLSSEVACF